MPYKLRFSQYNERSVLVEWQAIIDEKMLQDVLNFKNKIENKYIKQNIEVISAYSSMLINYDITIDNVNTRILELKRLYESSIILKQDKSRVFKIPVCYDAEFAIDLEAYSKEKNVSKTEIIKLHSQAIYTVYFIGFLPGFLYLGNLNPNLYLDRKTTPNLNVKKGSVAIGGKQTGIYPQDSPGGWHIIGNSPLELFNPKQNPPCFIKAGDKVKFHPISKSEYVQLQHKIENSTFNFNTLIADG